VVCQYPFHHFSDLRDIDDLSPEHYPTNTVAADGTYSDWRGREWVHVRSSVLETVVDERSYRNVGVLARAYLAENPEAALTEVEKLIQSLA
jgi:hypothetical protein